MLRVENWKKQWMEFKSCRRTQFWICEFNSHSSYIVKCMKKGKVRRKKVQDGGPEKINFIWRRVSSIIRFKNSALSTSFVGKNRLSPPPLFNQRKSWNRRQLLSSLKRRGWIISIGVRAGKNDLGYRHLLTLAFIIISFPSNPSNFCRGTLRSPFIVNIVPNLFLSLPFLSPFDFDGFKFLSK